MSKKTVEDLIEYLQTLPGDTIILTLKREQGSNWSGDSVGWESDISFDPYSNQFEFIDWDLNQFVKEDDPRKHTKELYIGES